MLDAASWRKLVQFEDSKGHDEAKLRESTRKAVNEIFLCHRTQVCPGAHGTGNLQCGDSVELAYSFFSFFCLFYMFLGTVRDHILHSDSYLRRIDVMLI